MQEGGGTSTTKDRKVTVPAATKLSDKKLSHVTPPTNAKLSQTLGIKRKNVENLGIKGTLGPRIALDLKTIVTPKISTTFGKWEEYKKFVEAPLIGTELAAKSSFFEKMIRCILKPVHISERQVTSVGRGSFGSVDRVCMYEEEGRYVAVKTMYISGNPAKLRGAINEINVLSALSGQNIFPPFHAAKIEPDGLKQKAYIIMGYCTNTLVTLAHAEQLAIMPTVISNVKKLHAAGYVHFDLKPENICVDGLLLDAGSTRRIGSDYILDSIGQTLGYSINLNSRVNFKKSNSRIPDSFATQLYNQLSQSGKIVVDPIFDIYSLFQMYSRLQLAAGIAVTDWKTFYKDFNDAPILAGGYRQTRRRKSRQKKVTRRRRRPA